MSHSPTEPGPSRAMLSRPTSGRDPERDYGTMTPAPGQSQIPRESVGQRVSRYVRGPPEIRDFGSFGEGSEVVGGEGHRELEFTELVGLSEVDKVMVQVNDAVRGIYKLMENNNWHRYTLNQMRGHRATYNVAMKTLKNLSECLNPAPNFASNWLFMNSSAVSCAGKKHIFPQKAYTLANALLDELRLIQSNPDAFANEDGEARKELRGRIVGALQEFDDGIQENTEETEKADKVNQKNFAKRVNWVVGGLIGLVLGAVSGRWSQKYYPNQAVGGNEEVEAGQNVDPEGYGNEHGADQDYYPNAQDALNLQGGAPADYNPRMEGYNNERGVHQNYPTAQDVRGVASADYNPHMEAPWPNQEGYGNGHGTYRDYLNAQDASNLQSDAPAYYNPHMEPPRPNQEGYDNGHGTYRDYPNAQDASYLQDRAPAYHNPHIEAHWQDPQGYGNERSTDQDYPTPQDVRGGTPADYNRHLEVPDRSYLSPSPLDHDWTPRPDNWAPRYQPEQPLAQPNNEYRNPPAIVIHETPRTRHAGYQDDQYPTMRGRGRREHDRNAARRHHGDGYDADPLGFEQYGGLQGLRTPEGNLLHTDCGGGEACSHPSSTGGYDSWAAGYQGEQTGGGYTGTPRIPASPTPGRRW